MALTGQKLHENAPCPNPPITLDVPTPMTMRTNIQNLFNIKNYLKTIQ